MKLQDEKYLIHILKCFISGEEPNASGNVDWDRLVYLAHINSVLGIVSYMIYEFRLQSDPEVLEACREYANIHYKEYRNLARKTEQLRKELQNASIDHVVFKGGEIRALYPVPEFRSFGDIDILIPEDQRDVCRKTMKELGYRESDAWEPVFNYKRGREYYEIHTALLETDLLGKPGCRAFFQDPLEHVTKQDEHRYSFDTEYHYLYLLTHLAKHMSASGAGIRMYLDLAVYVVHNGADMDWEEIQQDLKAMDLSQFAETAMTAVKRWFDVSSPLANNELSKELLNQLLDSVLQGGVFGRQNKDKGMLDLSKASREGMSMSRLTILKQRLFPPANQIKARYTYLQRWPKLLPVAWIHRFIITGRFRYLHRREIRELFAANRNDAKCWNDLLQLIGL